MTEDFEGIFTARITARALELQPTELDEAERGALFIAWPRPPRVGAFVRIDLAFGVEPPRPLEAMVVWSRPARPGVTAGFRAQLTAPPADVLHTLRALVETVRGRLVSREVGAPKAAKLDTGPIRERMTAQNASRDHEAPLAGNDFDQKRSSLMQPRPSSPPPAWAQAAAPPMTPRGVIAHTSARPTEIELPDDDATPLVFDSFASDEALADGRPLAVPPSEDQRFARQGGFELSLPEVGELEELPPEPPPIPVRAPRPAPPPPAPLRSEARVIPLDLGLAVAERNALDPSSFENLFADEAVPEPAPPARAQPPSPVAPIRLAFASGRSYLMHFERFLQRGELYITNAAPLRPGTVFEVLLEIPDGEAPTRASAIADREVRPPEVPRAGWVATLVDPHGEIGERLAEASFAVTTPLIS